MARRDPLTLGVDFGTTHCSAGVLVGGEVQLVLERGDPAIPSLVHFPRRGDPIVGSEAKRMMVVDPTNTVRSIKRVLGARPDTAPVRRFAASAGYALKRGPNDRLVLGLGASDVTCEQVVSLFFAHMREAAERRFGGRVERAVATVPADASASYLEALHRAAKLAHLEVVETIPEPVAGALSLGIHLEPQDRRLLVCDFGGGTFDATVIDAGHRRLDVLACAGDGLLGGDDLDDALLAGVGSAIFKRASFEISRDAVRHQRLLQRCESVKRGLSSHVNVRLRVKDAYVHQRQACDIDTIIERAWAEARWKHLFERAMGVIDGLLDTVSWRDGDVDQVALIGGTSLVPLFRRMLGQRFGASNLVHGDGGHTAVARGAVLRAGHLQSVARAA